MDKQAKKEERYARLFNYYRRDEAGNYIIEFSIPSIEKLFSPYDPSPMPEKDINPDIIKIILEQLVIFPKNANVELYIHLPKKLRRKNVEDDIMHALKSHFEYELIDSELHLKRRLQKGASTFVYAGTIFATLFTMSYFFGQSDNVILNLLAEGTAVGAWVSLWHPIEMILYDWLPLHEDMKKYERLTKMNLKLKYV